MGGIPQPPLPAFPSPILIPLFASPDTELKVAGKKKIIRWKSKIRRGALAAGAKPAQHSAGAS